MSRWIKWALGLVLLVVVAVGLLILAGERMAVQRASRVVTIEVSPVAYRTDAPALERGRYLFTSRGCAECHGASGGGHTLVDDGSTRLAGPNITPGNPGLAAYQPQDWVRSIRHGVDPRGRPLRLMPSEDFNRFTDDDLASVVGYVRQLPPASGNLKATLEFPLPARVLYGFGAIPEAVEKIDHKLAPSRPVPEGVTVEHGRYVAQMCIGCHGATLAGGKINGGPPDWPPAARLAPGEGSVIGRYPDAATFVRMIRSGKRPDGTTVAVMPSASLASLSETDVQAVYLYLRSLPGK